MWNFSPIIRSSPSWASVLPALTEGVSPELHNLPGRTARGRPSTRDGLYAVLDHEVDAALVGTDNGLPALDGEVLGPGDEGDFLKLVASVGNTGRDIEILAVVGEGAVVEGLEDDLDLLFEIVPVGVPVQHGGAEGLDLPGVIAAPDTEDDAAVGEVVSEGVVLGEAEGIPHGGNIERAAELQVLGDVGQVNALEQEVGEALVAFALEVVLGEPQGMVAEAVGGLGYLVGDGEGGGEVLV